MYLKTAVLPLDSSLLRNKSQNTKELICWAYTLLVITVINPVRSCLFILSTYLAQSLSVEVLCTSPRDTSIVKDISHSGLRGRKIVSIDFKLIL